jgi:hypothetical protein
MRRVDCRRVYTLFLSHGPSKVFRGRPHISAHIHGKPRNYIGEILGMATTTSVKEQWPASRVRDTFLSYFEKNGHTLGMRTPGDFLCY